MIGALALAALLNAAPPPEAVDTGARIDAAMAAEQGLQGPLDGGWTLRDDDGRPLYRFEMVDPAGGHGPLTGAWRDMGVGAQAGGVGVITDMRLEGRNLRLEFATGGGPVATIRLRERSPSLWAGRLSAGGAARSVVLRRD
jgi:hypothetical protein